MRCWSKLGVLVLAASAVLETSASEGRLVNWPDGWRVSRVPAVASADTPLSRERAVKLAPDGSQALVMEATRSRLATAHDVDLQRVILQMRKALQVDFTRQGLQAVCSRPRESSLGGLAALELVCSVSRNGSEVLKQVIQVAIGSQMAYSLSYAMPAEQYPLQRDAVDAVRATIKWQ